MSEEVKKECACKGVLKGGVIHTPTSCYEYPMSEEEVIKIFPEFKHLQDSVKNLKEANRNLDAFIDAVCKNYNIDKSKLQ